MLSLFENYVNSISSKFSHPETSEMGYRSDFETLLRGVFESINVKRIDHDARAVKGNKPDFIVLKNDVPKNDLIFPSQYWFSKVSSSSIPNL